MNEDHLKMLRQAMQPATAQCLHDISNAAGYEISAKRRKAFLRFHAYITNPEPAFISKWRQCKEKEHFYHRLVNGILGDTQNAYLCVHYHFERLSSIEDEVIKIVEKYNYKEMLGNSTMGIGNSLMWDFEYQAFVLAYRRCLDYLARSLCVFFRQEFHSFRKLPDFLAKAKPQSVAAALIEAHKNCVAGFGFVLSEGVIKSVRDKISHYEFVGAGCINLNRNGFILVGGGEQLSGSLQHNQSLSTVLNNKVLLLENCLQDMLFIFEEQVKKWEETLVGTP